MDTIVTNWVSAHANLAYGLCAVALDSKGNEGFACAGKADASNGLDKNTLFQIGSVTKTFTATLLAKRIVEGEYSLSDKFDSHLPSAFKKGSKDPITVLQIATHHSGLPRTPPAYLGETGEFTQFDDCIDSHCLGSGYLYSNWGYQLLGYTISKEDNLTYFDDLFYSTLFLLNMGVTKTHEEWLDADPTYFAAHAAAKHTSTGASLGTGPASDCPTANPSGCLYSSSHDMRIWLQFAMGLVTPAGDYDEARHELRKFYPQGDSPTATLQGLGWGFYNAEDDTACDVLPKPHGAQTHYTRVDKSGDVSGSHAAIYFLQDPSDPDGVSPLGVVVMANSDLYGGGDLKVAARSLLEELPLP